MEDEKQKAKAKRDIILWMIIGFVMLLAALFSYPDLDNTDYFIICAVILLEAISIYQLIRIKKKEG